MSPEPPKWLSVRLVLVLHDEALAQFGGLSGVRDEGLLESAIQRPRQLYHYGENPSLFGLTASLCLGLVKNHPFVDGNKRTACLSSAVFLFRNGWDFAPRPGGPTNIIRAVAAGEADEVLLSRWFEEFSSPVK